MQDLSENDWSSPQTEGKTVTVDLSDGRTIPIPLSPDTICNQTTHGR